MDSLSYAFGASDTILLLSDSALKHMFSYRQIDSESTEAGGQLFATIIGQKVEIVLASGPNREDRRARRFFQPNRKMEQREIQKQRLNGFHFVGDWHTHPEAKPRPSNRDIESMCDLFKKSDHTLAGFVLIIVGLLEPPNGIYVGVCNGVELNQLQVVGG